MSLQARFQFQGTPYEQPDFKALHKEARSAADATKALKEWTAYGYEDVEAWINDYKKGQTDLFWLCVVPLGEPLALVETHRAITDDFFIKKNPYVDARTWKEAVSKQSTIKNRMLLYPRGTFKSSIDRLDIVQWIICFPNIRILVMTAEESLAESFVKDVKKHFLVPENTKLTRFQMLYFAHCERASKKGAANEYTTRARTLEQPEPTVLALSLGMSTAGKHFDVGKFDDCVSEINSGPRATPEQRKTVSDDLKLKRYLIDGYGFRDYVGTIYDPADGYGVLQLTIPELLVRKKPALWLKEESITKPKNLLTEADYHLLFPVDAAGVERLTYKFLRAEQDIDEYLFSCQYLLEPLASRTVKFTDQLLRSHITQAEGFPQSGTYRIFSAWDLAYSVEAGRDYSVGCVGWFVVSGPLAGKMFIVEMIRGRFSKFELAFKIADMASRWKVERLGIENSPGASFLDTDIRQQLIRCGHASCPIDWFPVDTQKGAKNARAEGIEILLMNDRLWFSSEIAILDDVIKEFINFKPGSKRKDDCVDSVGHLARYMPSNVEIPHTEQEQFDAVLDILRQKDLHDRLYPGYVAPEPVPESVPTTYEGLPIFYHPDHLIYGT